MPKPPPPTDPAFLQPELADSDSLNNDFEFQEDDGNGARVPVTWLVAANDTYFPPDFSRALADAFRRGGGKTDFHELAATGDEGHWLAETESGVALAGPDLARALKPGHPAVTGPR